LNGHVGGHYLSALAMQYAATGNTRCRDSMNYAISELQACQVANGNSGANFVGYVSGIPDGKSCWNRVKNDEETAVNGWWVPWYNIHKTYAGLRDAWLYTGNTTARTMFLSLCDWGINICSSLDDNEMQTMLGQEHGGINEMYADAYQMTNDAKYLTFARRFSHNWLLNAMAAGTDNLDNAHANTQVPKAIGFQRIGELGGGSNYTNAAAFFWTTVTANRSLAIGGNSEDEHFRQSNQWMEYINERNGMETCNTHNMMKLTEGLFRMTKQAKYADFYERALFNHILASQHPTHGGYVYFTATHPRHYRVYSNPNECMWCCVGTGMENHTKYGQFIYTHHTDSLFVNLFIASQVNWSARGVTIRQETAFPDTERTRLTITTSSPNAFKLFVRHPAWVRSGEMKVIVGTDTTTSTQPSSYVQLNRTWNNGDVVTVLLPMHFTFEQLNNVPTYVALMRGPIVLGAKTGTADLTGLISGDGRWDHCPNGTLYDVSAAPRLTINRGTYESQFVPVAGRTLAYTAPNLMVNAADRGLVIEPFFRIHDARYMMYWNATITGTGVTSRQKIPAAPGICQSTGALRFSFTAEDPSRYVLLYTLSGKRVACIPAFSRTVTLNYLKQGIMMQNGMYAVQVISKNECHVSKTFFVAH
ncbi:MAG: glycoside hydrolase family 127 protein, partial [Chitinispirillaceae bacterium]|nr:glycoside hydrolase family 127 protein [Chitinispirillaceae bacterium]